MVFLPNAELLESSISNGYDSSYERVIPGHPTDDIPVSKLKNFNIFDPLVD